MDTTFEWIDINYDVSCVDSSGKRIRRKVLQGLNGIGKKIMIRILKMIIIAN